MRKKIKKLSQLAPAKSVELLNCLALKTRLHNQDYVILDSLEELERKCKIIGCEELSMFDAIKQLFKKPKKKSHLKKKLK